MKNCTSKKHDPIPRRQLLKSLGVGAVAATAAGNGVATAVASNVESYVGPEKEISLLVDFSDHDYSEVVMKHAGQFDGMNAQLLMRETYYIDDGRIQNLFTKIYDHQYREQVLANSACVITACHQTAMQAHALGAKVIYAKHAYSPANIEDRFSPFNISVVDLADTLAVLKAISTI